MAFNDGGREQIVPLILEQDLVKLQIVLACTLLHRSSHLIILLVMKHCQVALLTQNNPFEVDRILCLDVGEREIGNTQM